MAEMAIAALLCQLLSGGETEHKHDIPHLHTPSYVRVDCETNTHVIEFGLDNKPGSRDSVHQAAFAAFLSDKEPMVVVIDTDGIEDRYQYEVRIVADRLGVAYGWCSEDFVRRWAATAPWRSVGLDKSLHDLPVFAVAKRHCDLGGEFTAPQ